MKAFKVCSCGKEYSSLEIFRELDFVGVIKTGKYSETDLEMRNCSCKSSIAVNVKKGEDCGKIRLSS